MIARQHLGNAIHSSFRLRNPKTINSKLLVY